MDLFDVFNNVTTEEAVYLVTIITSIIAVIYNFIQYRNESNGSYIKPTINMIGIISSIITAAIFSYIYYKKDYDFLIFGYASGGLSLITTLLNFAI